MKKYSHGFQFVFVLFLFFITLITISIYGEQTSIKQSLAASQNNLLAQAFPSNTVCGGSQYCVPSVSPIIQPSSNPSTSPSLPIASISAAIPSLSISQAPCTPVNYQSRDSRARGHHHHHKHGGSGGNGAISSFIQQLLNLIMQLLNQLIALLGGSPLPISPTPSSTPNIPGPSGSVPVPSTTVPNPCPPSTAPSQPSAAPSQPYNAPSGTASSPVPSTTVVNPSQPATSGSWWKPGPTALEWQWEISHPLDTNSASDMGTGKTANNGATAPATDPVVYDIDGFDNTAATVSTLHSMGKKVVCYIEVGADDGRSDSAALQATGEGNAIPGWPGEHYINIANPTVVSTIKARIAMCAQKGFDAIEPDIDESYGSSTGFPLTKAIEEAYMTDLTNYAHSLGIAMWGKNPDDTGDSYAADMVNVFDAILTEQCNEMGTCDALSGYTGIKPVFNAEYNQTPSQFCAADNARAGWNGVQFVVGLDGSMRNICR